MITRSTPPVAASQYDDNEIVNPTASAHMDDILAATSAGNYVEFILADGRRPLMRVTLAAVEGEITAIRMILTGRLAGVPSQTIRERLRDLYV